MKSLIGIASFAFLCASAPMSHAQSSPVLTWNKTALEAVERAKPTQHQAIRLLAHVSLAQYAALTSLDNGDAAREATGTASMQVIAELLPSQAGFAQERLRQSPAAATEHGQRIAQRVLSEARNDGFANMWRGDVPQAAYAWRSLVKPPAPPAYPAIGAMRTFLLDRGSDFRPANAPAPGSARFAADLAEVRRHTEAPTEESTRIAKFYDMTSGSLVAGFWNERAAELIREHAIDDRRAAAMLATMNTSMMDAVIACHDAKYVHWVPRPSQADPSIKPLIGVPNHPSYPSNHSCISTAAALVLAHFFPGDRARLETIATEAGVSRIYAGLHYRFDVTAGEDIGRKVSAAAVARYGDMLARWTRTLLAQQTPH